MAQWRTSCMPDKSVLYSTPGERTIARFFDMALPVQDLVKDTNKARLDLAGDLFLALWQSHPETLPEEKLSESRKLNKRILDWTMSQPYFEEARSSTVNNILTSIMSSQMLFGRLTDEPALQKILKLLNDVSDREGEIERLKEEMKSERRFMKSKDVFVRAQATQDNEERKQHIENLKNDLKSKSKEAQEVMDKIADSRIGQGMMNDMLASAKQEADKTKELMVSWGIGQGEITNSDVQMLMNINRSDLKMITDMVGRMKGVATAAIERTKKADTGTTVEAAMTKDIRRIFPDQRAYLTAKAPRYLRVKAVSALVNGVGLPGWRPKVEGQKSGAFIALVDRSGSMSGAPLIAAKSIAMGMALALREEKLVQRRYALYYFDGGDPNYIRYHLPHVTSEDSWREHVAWGRLQSGGGTVFDFAMQFAIEELKMFKKSGVDGADLLFITDEESSLSQETIENWKKLTAELDTRLMLISIGSYHLYELDEISDVIIHVENHGQLSGMAGKIVDGLTASVIKNDLKK